jgi:hypothetical protein
MGNHVDRLELLAEGNRVLDELRYGFYYDFRSDHAIEFVNKSEERLRVILRALADQPASSAEQEPQEQRGAADQQDGSQIRRA